MTVTLRQLRYLLSAADEGTMTAAAARLHVSQSTISLAIADLERYLGVDLLIRNNPRQLSFTLAGRQLLTDARRLLASVDDLETTARSFGTMVAGRLAFGCYRTLAPFLLPRIFEEFAQLYPDVELEAVEDGADELQAAVLQGELEVALVYDLDLSSRLESHLLYNTWPHVLLAENHPLAAGPTVSITSLRSEPLILFSPPGDYYLRLLSSWGVTPHIRYRSPSFETVRSIVARGMGYSVLQQRPAIDASYEGRALAIRPVAEPVAGLGVTVVKAADVRPTRRAQAFTDYCASTFAHGPINR